MTASEPDPPMSHPGGAQAAGSAAPRPPRRRRSDYRRFERLALDVLDRRDRDRRGGSVLPDSTRHLGKNALDIADPTGIAAERCLTGDIPRDPVHERLVEDERDLARVADRLGVGHHFRSPQ